jgi:signal transduction histidine kinase
MEDGAWPPASTGVDFIVQAAWWETGPTRVAALLIGLGAVAWLVRGIVLMRVRASIRRLRRAREVERERARIARDMHDELGANLTQINMVSRLACMDSPEAARGHLEEISTIARRTVDSLDEIVWAVNPRYDTLAALIEYLGMYAASFLASVKIACETDVPQDLPPRPLSANVRYHLFLAVKEALNNAAKHSGARTVRLTAAWDGRRLSVVVADDGRGFDPGPEQMGSEGLKNLRDRMKELRGECRIESREGGGTRVVLELPLGWERSRLGSAPG